MEPPPAPTPSYEEEDAPGMVKPCILLMGPRKGGKSSILRVVFYKLSPHETQFLESTTTVEKSEIANSSYIQFEVWDFPGQANYLGEEFVTESVFARCNAIIFVLDAQSDRDELIDALNTIQETVVSAAKANPKILFEVFVHKADGLQPDAKLEAQRSIQKAMRNDLHEMELDHVPIAFHLTSIYDHSIFEAFSKVAQKLIPQLPTLEYLHDTLNTSSRLEKSFLFDVVSKLYLATDSAPVDMASYDLCSDMIDVVLDVSCIYGLQGNGYALAYDTQSGSMVKLNNGTVLYLRQVDRYLAIVCIMNSEALQSKGLIDYNVACFKEGVRNVFHGTTSS